MCPNGETYCSRNSLLEEKGRVVSNVLSVGVLEVIGLLSLFSLFPNIPLAAHNSFVTLVLCPNGKRIDANKLLPNQCYLSYNNYLIINNDMVNLSMNKR